jgi:hypothetical protein
VRFFEDSVEYRLEVAGRRIDDLQDLRGRRFSCESFVTLGSRFGQLTPQLVDKLGRELSGVSISKTCYRPQSCSIIR